MLSFIIIILIIILVIILIIIWSSSRLLVVIIVVISVKTFSILIFFHVITGVLDIICAECLGISLELTLSIFAGLAGLLDRTTTNVVKKAVLLIFLNVHRRAQFLKLLVEFFKVKIFLFLRHLGLGLKGLSRNLTLGSQNHQIFDIGPFKHNLFIGL